METFAQRLLAIRGATKQGVFAQELDINPNTLRAYEEGRSLPNQEVLERVCVKFSVSPQWLLLGTGPMRTDDKLTAPPIPEGAVVKLDIVYDVVELLEEYLRQTGKALKPSTKAEVVRQICQAVTESEAQEEVRPAQMLRLIHGALGKAANE